MANDKSRLAGDSARSFEDGVSLSAGRDAACEPGKLAGQHRVDLSGLTREEVWRQLLGLMQGARGDRARVPSQKTVGRWLERWVEDGLMERDKRAVQGRGKAPIIYKVARALSLIGCPLSDDPPEFFQRKESLSDTETECPIIEVGEAEPPAEEAPSASLSDTADFVRKTNRVTEGDLADHRPKDIPTGTTRAPARAETEDVTPCWEAEPYPGDYADDSGCALP
ncbi:hypothetical protein KBZ15_13170 [Cyanobium sp. BA20m-p-22]|uniref:hypothetical protein n=1 Tax=Cyanobium sp. BA20m-p-22 TaxID=2823704 RepID=UPI0020CDD34E|nr:hypothetical protein [Cyanobium sp. BA20m-p-22]MCP9910842.1 hypothetical protein [Cyanobium sp. BA20m-p-22]